MSVSRKVVAEVSEVPEEYVKCKTCDAYSNGRCIAWNSPIQDDDFCSFWVDKEEAK